MFKESGPKKNTENFEKGRNIDWESLNFKEIYERLFKYPKKSDTDKLKLAKEKKGEGYSFSVYCDPNGRLVRVEREESFSGDYESSERRSQKEYEFMDNGSISSIRYFRHADADYDGMGHNNDYVGEIKFEYSGGRIKKALVKEVCSGFDEGTDEKNFNYGKDYTYYFEYDASGVISQVIKEEKKFGENKVEKTILYDKDKDKNKVFVRMDAAEIVEYNLTKDNDIYSLDSKNK